MREVIAEGKADKGVAKRFALLDAISNGDQEAMRSALPEAMKESTPAIKADPFWVRTFLITSLRLGLTEERDMALRDGVNHCPQLRADERTLINGIVEASKLTPIGPALVRTAEPDEEAAAE